MKSVVVCSRLVVTAAVARVVERSGTRHSLEDDVGREGRRFFFSYCSLLILQQLVGMVGQAGRQPDRQTDRQTGRSGGRSLGQLTNTIECPGAGRSIWRLRWPLSSLFFVCFRTHLAILLFLLPHPRTHSFPNSRLIHHSGQPRGSRSSTRSRCRRRRRRPAHTG